MVQQNTGEQLPNYVASYAKGQDFSLSLSHDPNISQLQHLSQSLL